jgi:hypothetical protein
MKKIWIIICVYVYCNCGVKQLHNVDTTYVIDLDTVEKEDTVIKMSSFFKKVNTIILEDHDYALIGNISAIQVHEEYIFVLDYHIAKKLFIFDRTGKFVRQIGSTGQGPGEYLTINDFCLDCENREVYLLDSWGGKVLKYDWNGEYISSIRLMRNYYYSNIAYSEKQLYCSILPDDKEKSNNLLVKIDIETGEYKEYLNADEYNQGWNNAYYPEWGFFRYKTEPSKLKFWELYMNTVMLIKNDTVYPYLTIKHKNWISKGDLLSDEQFEKHDIKDVSHVAKTGKAHTIFSYFEYNDVIFFGYIQGLNGGACVLYDKKNNESHQYKYLKNDLLFRDEEVGTKFSFINSKAAYDYCSIHMLPVLYGAKNGLISNLNFSPNLDKKDELLKLSEEQFVIFEYEFK